MYKPLGELLDSQPREWLDDDVRGLIERYLRDVCKTERLYCGRVEAGAAHIRVGTTTLNQTVRLLFPDLVQHVKREAGYELKEVLVVLAV